MSEVDQASKLLEAALTKVQTEAASGKRVLFPNGIDQLRLKVQIGPEGAPLALVEIEAAGPDAKPSANYADADDSAFGAVQLKAGLWKIFYGTTLIGEIWVSPDQTEEHWFFQGGFLESGQPVKFQFVTGAKDTLDDVKNRSRATRFYVACTCKPTVTPGNY